MPGGADDRPRLLALSEEEPHVHGELEWTVGSRRVPHMRGADDRLPLLALGESEWTVGSRRVPHMGFWGADDVCLGEWWDELTGAIEALASGHPYTLDFGEQGEPAFALERRGTAVCPSWLGWAVVTRILSRWSLRSDDLRAAVRSFEEDLAGNSSAKGPPSTRLSGDSPVGT